MLTRVSKDTEGLGLIWIKDLPVGLLLESHLNTESQTFCLYNKGSEKGEISRFIHVTTTDLNYLLFLAE